MSKHGFIDIRVLLDEIFGAAEEFKYAFSKEFGKDSSCCSEQDFYPGYSYPPSNVYISEDRTMVLQFALAGFAESNINLEFKGDYLLFSAVSDLEHPDNVQYVKRRLKLRNIEEQRYFVPADKYDQEKVTASFVHSILTVSIPPRDIIPQKEGIKVNIKSSDSTESSGTEKINKIQ